MPDGGLRRLYLESLSQNGHCIVVSDAVVLRPSDEDDHRTSPAGCADLVHEPTGGAGVLGDYERRTCLDQGGVVGFLGERPLGADQALALEPEGDALLHGIHGREHPGDDPVLVIRDAGVLLDLLRPRCCEDYAICSAEVVDGLLHRSDGYDVVAFDGGAVPSDPYELRAGPLARLADVLGYPGRVGMGRIDHQADAFRLDLPGDALRASAAADINLHPPFVHDVRSVLCGDPHMDVQSGGREPIRERPALGRA